MTRISDPLFAERVLASFPRQNAMTLIQAGLSDGDYGRVESVCRTGQASSHSTVKDGEETLCALMLQTIMVLHGKTEK